MKSETNYFELKGYKVLIDSNEILFNGNVIKLTPKEKDVLLILYNNRGSTVSRSKILEVAWGGSFGNDSGLTQAISRLRQIFKDDPKQPKLIKTIPKMGYQLMVDSHHTVNTEKNKLSIYNRYRNLSKLEKTGIKIILIVIIFVLLFFVIDIQIRVEEL